MSVFVYNFGVQTANRTVEGKLSRALVCEFLNPHVVVELVVNHLSVVLHANWAIIDTEACLQTYFQCPDQKCEIIILLISRTNMCITFAAFPGSILSPPPALL